MLVLSRKVGESVVISDDIVVTITAIRGDSVRLGIKAPRHVPVDREEVHERKTQFADPCLALASR